MNEPPVVGWRTRKPLKDGPESVSVDATPVCNAGLACQTAHASIGASCSSTFQHASYRYGVASVAALNWSMVAAGPARGSQRRELLDLQGQQGFQVPLRHGLCGPCERTHPSQLPGPYECALTPTPPSNAQQKRSARGPARWLVLADPCILRTSREERSRTTDRALRAPCDTRLQATVASQLGKMASTIRVGRTTT